MAYVYRDEKNDQDITEGNVLSSAPLDTGTSQATGGNTPEKVSKSGSWVNLNQYLKNQPQIEQTAQKLVGGPITKSDEAQTAIIDAQNKLQTQAPKDITAQQKSVLEGALVNPLDNTNLAKQTYSDVSKPFTGSTKVNTAEYQPMYDEAKRINESKQKSIQDQLQTQYNDNMSAGKKALDLFALRNDPSSSALIENARELAITRQKALDDLLAKNTAIESNIQNILKNKQSYLNTLAPKAKQSYSDIQKDIEKRYDVNAPIIQNQLTNDVNLIRNFKEIAPERAKALGINADLYNKTMKDKLTTEGWYQSRPGYDANQIRLGEANRAISDLTGYLIGTNPEVGNKLLDAIWTYGPNSPQYNNAIDAQAKIMGQTPEQLKNNVVTILDLMGRNKSNSRNPSAAPDVSNRPVYGDYITTNLLPTDRNAFATQDEINRENALNDIFGLGNATKQVENSNAYGARIDEKKYYNDLLNYLNNTLVKKS